MPFEMEEPVDLFQVDETLLEANSNPETIQLSPLRRNAWPHEQLMGKRPAAVSLSTPTEILVKDQHQRPYELYCDLQALRWTVSIHLFPSSPIFD